MSAMLKLGDGTWLTCDSVGHNVCKAGDCERRRQGRHVTGLCRSSHFQQTPLGVLNSKVQFVVQFFSIRYK